MKLHKYILLFIFSLLLNSNVSATEIVVVENHCDTISKGLSPLHKYFDDLDYYLAHFTDMPGSNKLNHWVLGKNVNGDVVSNHNWSEINQTIDYLKRHQIHTKTDVEFGKLFQQDATSKSCDIYFKDDGLDNFIELKNVDFTNITDLSVLNTGVSSMQRINQVIGPKGAFSRINNINEYKWVATALKNNEITHLKQLWKQAFSDNAETAFNTIWDNNNLRTSLFGSGISKADAELDFLDLINELDNPNVTNPILYSFIKAE